MNVCQKCGDKGDLKYLIYCVRCKDSAEHRYCLDILPKSKTEKVLWTCEECAAKETKPSLVPSRKSERISLAADVKLSRKKMRKQISFTNNKAPVHMDSLPEAKPSGGDCLLFNEDSQKLLALDATSGNQEFRKPKRRLLLEDGDKSDEESEPVQTEASQLVSAVIDGDKSDEESEPVQTEASQLVSTVIDDPLITSSSLLFLKSDKYVHFPMDDPIWRGRFIINNVELQTSVGLVSHLMKKVCSKACNAVNSLPLLLSVEILSKFDVWPHRFQISPPSDDSIFLYFFPVYESDEKVFDALLDNMINRNLALKAVTKEAELLVFSSRELPLGHWRFFRKYYMWGVLEPTNHLH